MTFLVLAPGNPDPIDPQRLARATGGLPVTWFDPSQPELGGAICLSPLANFARISAGNGQSFILVGRVRLDRREELRTRLAGDSSSGSARLSDGELCLHAYAKWGPDFVEQIHGDFAFVVFDTVTRALICVRDRFGVRTLVWHRNGHEFWAGGSMHELTKVARFSSLELDRKWIADFLRTGVCDDPSRTAYAGLHRLPPATTLTLRDGILAERRYWRLAVNAPVHLGSASAYEDAFHSLLDAAIRDRLPSDRLGILISGGLDSSTLAAKTLQLGVKPDRLAARTWLVGGDADPEGPASAVVARFLGLERTVVDAGRLRLDPFWPIKEAMTPEPSYSVMAPPEHLADAMAMREQAACWFYGEGPDNALTFEWRMHLDWLVKQRQWARLPGVIGSYLGTKSLADWKTSITSRADRSGASMNGTLAEPAWVRGAGKVGEADQTFTWRPRAHQGLASPLWQSMFEGLDAGGDRVGIEWRHPYMDLRVLEFMLATPPIPWARHKLLIRRAMRGLLPEDTLRRPKTPLYKDDLGELMRRHLPAMPKRGDPVEEFVDLSLLPDDPASSPDIYALTRVAIVAHWLKAHHA